MYGWLIPFDEEHEEISLERPGVVDTGYESNYAFVNMGTNVIIITIVFLFMLLLLCTLPIKSKKSRSGRYHRKCSQFLFWNFWLRLLIQGCLEIGISAWVYVLDRSILLEKVPNYDIFFFVNDLLSYTLIAIFICMPIWITYFYNKRFS